VVVDINLFGDVTWRDEPHTGDLARILTFERLRMSSLSLCKRFWSSSFPFKPFSFVVSTVDSSIVVIVDVNESTHWPCSMKDACHIISYSLHFVFELCVFQCDIRPERVSLII
jgi:hypothetical protein